MSRISNILQSTLCALKKRSFLMLTLYFLILQSMFDVLMIPGAFGHGTWWLLSALLAKTASSMALASISLVSRRRWPMLVVASILAVWIVANAMYYHATGLYITFDVIAMAGGLHGFTSSLSSYFRWDVVVLILIAFLIVPIQFLPKPERSWRRFCNIWIAILSCTILGCFTHYLYKHEHDKPMPAIPTDYFRIFDFYGEAKPKKWIDGENWYIERHSISMAIPHLLVHAYNLHHEELTNSQIQLTPSELDYLDATHRQTTRSESIEGHLVIILVESLESWALEEHDIHGREITPNINRLAHKDSVLIARQLLCQKRYGESGDGQLILNTGLLPVREGVACMKYADRTYPNIAHLYPNSAIINPVKNAWNQTLITPRYGYKQLIEPEGVTKKETWNDAMVISHTRQMLDTATVPTCLLAITISSHTPFDRVEPTLALSSDLTPERNRYLQCIHYADSCIGTFLNWADTASTMKGATIVITSDHNIFPKSKLPLIICSPRNKDRLEIEGMCYQMDIYPTILEAIDQQGYGWHGFGRSLYGPADRNIETDSAYILSDKLIRMDYFKDRPLSR